MCASEFTGNINGIEGKNRPILKVLDNEKRFYDGAVNIEGQTHYVEIGLADRTNADGTTATLTVKLFDSDYNPVIDESQEVPAARGSVAVENIDYRHTYRRVTGVVTAGTFDKNTRGKKII